MITAAVDLGTTSVRVGLFDEAGRRLTLLQAPLPSVFPRPGQVEQDPDLLVSLPLELLRQTMAEARVTAADVGAMGIACQRGTIIAWDAESTRPVTPAIGWQDSRTRGRVDELRAIGIPVNTMASCTKIEWLLQEHEPARAAHRAGRLRIGTVDTWLTWALSGGEAFVTDPSNAGATGLYDSGQRDWSEGALDLFHVDRSVLAEVVATAAPVARIRADHLGVELPITARAGDQQAACFAHGLGEGEAKLTLGTSAMLDVRLGSEVPPRPDGAHVLPLWRIGDAEPSLIEGTVATAGGTIEWLMRMGLLGSIELLDDMVAAGRESVLMVPALAGLGTPHDDSAARGVTVGIDLGTEPADIVAGAVEGIAQRCAEVADALGVGPRIRVDGGLSRSPAVLQRIADATGRVISPAVDPETTLAGAARLAAAVGAELPVAELDEPFEPELDDIERARRRARFTAAVEAARSR